MESHIEFKPPTPGHLGTNNPHLLISLLPLHCGVLQNFCPISSWFIQSQLIRIFCFDNSALSASSVRSVPYWGRTLMDRYWGEAIWKQTAPELRDEIPACRAEELVYDTWMSSAACGRVDGRRHCQVAHPHEVHWNFFKTWIQLPTDGLSKEIPGANQGPVNWTWNTSMSKSERKWGDISLLRILSLNFALFQIRSHF